MPTLAYLGVRRPDGATTVLAIDDFERPGRALPLRRDLARHSFEFEWGYAGPGPAQLALAILADYLGDDQLAFHFHHSFVGVAVAGFRSGAWAMRGEDIAACLGRLAGARRPALVLHAGGRA
jgi:hypothetical protein